MCGWHMGWGLFDCKIKLVHPKGNQPRIFIGRTGAEAEAPVLWPPDVKSWLFGRDPDAKEDRKQKEKGTTEDEMVGWHHWLDGHESEQALGDGKGQGSLACSSAWGCKVSDMTELLNSNNCILPYTGNFRTTLCFTPRHPPQWACPASRLLSAGEGWSIWNPDQLIISFSLEYFFNEAGTCL